MTPSSARSTRINNWAPYQRLTGTALRAILHTEHGITVPRAHNT